MSHFIISLDFELMWGMRDYYSKDSYGRNILGAREAIPLMLDLFAKHEIGATWSTVGLLFCENRDELMDMVSKVEVKPNYKNSRRSNYSYLDEVGKDEKTDPYYYGLSLIKDINSTPKQKIGTHTFSHYYCQEAGADVASFRSDLRAAHIIAKRHNIELSSIVFPRNQYTTDFLKVCSEMGINVFRGNPENYIYKPASRAGFAHIVRAKRLIDAHTGYSGHHTFLKTNEQKMVNLPASRFLRPNSGQLSRLNRFHLATIKRGMTKAAKENSNYHLWWHPHNFGLNTAENLVALGSIVDHYTVLKDKYGFQSSSMEVAAQ